MLYLKEINFEDYAQEYAAITKIPAEENGFVNRFANATLSEFQNKVIQYCLDSGAGKNLAIGKVAQVITSYGMMQ